MSSLYGLAADQVLALEVVLANGRFVTVTEESDPDHFWALRGGGGGMCTLSLSFSPIHLPRFHLTYSH
jgi:FAD/FMN-containing dehydrogenase